MSVGGRPSAPLGRGSVADHCSTGMSIGIACPSRGSARSVLSLYRAECLHQNPLSQIPGQPGPSMQAVLRVRGWMPQRRARNPKGNTIVQPRLKLRASKGIALSAIASSWKRRSLRYTGPYVYSRYWEHTTRAKDTTIFWDDRGERDGVQ